MTNVGTPAGAGGDVSDVAVTRAGAVLTLAFNRPQKKNAITLAMYRALADALHAASADAAVRAIVISGSPGVFTAGNDLEDFRRDPPSPDAGPVLDFMNALRDCDKPVVACVTGLAIGIGTTLLLHCDLVYASEQAHFALPFAQLGLCPEFGSSLLLPRLSGHHRAAELLMLGDPFDAGTAEELGLVNQLLAPSLLEDFVAAQAARLAAMPADALRTTKRLMKAAQAAQVSAVVQEELQEFARLLQGPDAKEALAAFVEKRKPVFNR